MLQSPIFNDIYFSPEDGLAETRHVFLENNGLPEAWVGRDWFCVGESGFGTGLNFLSLWTLFEQTTAPDAVLDYVSFEKYPLSADDIQTALAQWSDYFGGRLERLVRDYPLRNAGWHRVEFGRVRLTLIFDDINLALPRVVIPRGVDAWFLDGFAPAKNPQMWTPIVFENMARLSKAGTRFASFTAAGIVKQGLARAGFYVEKRKGYGRKRDMIAGHYTGAERDPVLGLGRGLKIAILGAGLAGAACAYILKNRGYHATVFDPASGPASGASGNFRGICNPRFTAQRMPESDFYAAAFSNIQRHAPQADRCGSLHLLVGAEKEQRFQSTLSSWGWHAESLRLLDAREASECAGVDVPTGALYVPDSIQLDPSRQVSDWLSGVDVVFGVRPDADMLRDFDGVIYANGVAARDYDGLNDLPIHTVRGQIIEVKATPQSKNLKTNLCYGGYIGAMVDGCHVVGSTFQKWLDDCDLRDDDTKDILSKMIQNVPGLDFSSGDVVRARASLRCASIDRFPIMGQCTQKRNHFVTTAHGSHGIIGALTGAILIADQIEGGVYCLPDDTVKLLSEKRFLDRAAKRAKKT